MALTDLQIQRLTDAIDRQTLCLTAAALLGTCWTEDESISQGRPARAILMARAILHDAKSTIDSQILFIEDPINLMNQTQTQTYILTKDEILKTPPAVFEALATNLRRLQEFDHYINYTCSLPRFDIIFQSATHIRGRDLSQELMTNWLRNEWNNVQAVGGTRKLLLDEIDKSINALFFPPAKGDPE